MIVNISNYSGVRSENSEVRMKNPRKTFKDSKNLYLNYLRFSYIIRFVRHYDPYGSSESSPETVQALA